MTSTPAQDRRWWTLAVVALVTFLTSLDNTVVNVALPSIQRDLHLGLAGLEWVASGYILVFATLLLAGGRLADLYGRRRLLLVGLALFTAASLLAGLAGSLPVLLAGRVLQGIGAALATPTTLAIITTTFPDERERNLAVGAWGGLAALALALGPLTGGFVSQHWHWGWIFLINVPLGAFTLAAGALVLPSSQERARPRHLDLAGLATSALVLLGLTYALVQGHDAGWASPPILAALALAVTATGGFLAAEARSRAPMVDLALFRARAFTGGLLALVLWGLGVLGVYFFTSLYLQTVLGFSPTRAGLAFVPMALLMAGSAPLATPASGRLGPNRTVAAGMGLIAAGMVVVAFLGAEATFADLMVPFALVGIGSGLTTPLTANVLAVLPADRAGVASGILNAAREVAGLLGVIVVGAVLAARQGAALAAGAAQGAAFLHGYASGLLAAALLVAIGGIVSLAALQRRATAPAKPAPEARPRPARPAGAPGPDPLPARLQPAAAVSAVGQRLDGPAPLQARS